ncbi:ATP-binding cassette domain-containing protein [Bacillus sonorensis]
MKSLFHRKKEMVHAVKNVSFSIPKGKIIGLIGANGAGKSTLIKLMTGLITPTSGRITVDSFTPHKKEPAFLRKIGVVLGQKNQLWWDLTPYETFLLHKEIYQISQDEFERSIERLTAALHVEHVVKSPVRNLSLGERMKCELIAALLHSPDILFLDEPTIGLDFIAQKNIRRFLKSYCRERDVTVILTSHYLPDIEELCEHLLILRDGELYYNGSLDGLPGLHDGEYKFLSITFSDKDSLSLLKQYGEIIEEHGHTILLKISRNLFSQALRDIINDCDIIHFEEKHTEIQFLLEEIYKQSEHVGDEKIEKIY